MAGTSRKTQADVALFNAYEEASEQNVKELARSFTCDAVRTIVRIMKNTKATPGVRRQCAMDILNQGWGRPDSRDDRGAGASGLTINIVKLSTGVVETIRSDIDAVDVTEALDVAKLIAEQKEATP